MAAAAARGILLESAAAEVVASDETEDWKRGEKATTGRAALFGHPRARAPPTARPRAIMSSSSAASTPPPPQRKKKESERDWATPRRVVLCVGDDDDANNVAWTWTASRLLEPADDVTLLKVWVPDDADFADDLEPRYAEDASFAADAASARRDLPPAVRAGVDARERAHSGSLTEVVLLRGARAGDGGGVASQIVRYCERHRATLVVLGARPRHGAVARVVLGSVSDAVVNALRVPCVVVRRGGASTAVGRLEVASGPGAAGASARVTDDERATEEVGGIAAAMASLDVTPEEEEEEEEEENASCAAAAWDAVRAAAEGDRPRPTPTPTPTPTPATPATPATAPPLPRGRRVVIAVDGSRVSRRMTTWCVERLLRPTDEVIFAHALKGATEAFSREHYAGAVSRAERDVEAAWHEIEPALRAEWTRAPYPELGPGEKTETKKSTRGDEEKEPPPPPPPPPPPRGVLFAGKQNASLVEKLPDAP